MAAKIERMYDLFGKTEQLKKCESCDHLVAERANRTYYKCEIYGLSDSEATDFRKSWAACGQYNRPWNGDIPVYKLYTGVSKKEDVQCEGQLSLF